MLHTTEIICFQPRKHSTDLHITEIEMDCILISGSITLLFLENIPSSQPQLKAQGLTVLLATTDIQICSLWDCIWTCTINVIGNKRNIILNYLVLLAVDIFLNNC